MRLRLPRLSWPRRSRRRSAEFFAWWPRRTLGGTIVWLERVRRVRTYRGLPERPAAPPSKEN